MLKTAFQPVERLRCAGQFILQLFLPDFTQEPAQLRTGVQAERDQIGAGQQGGAELGLGCQFTGLGHQKVMDVQAPV